MKSKVFKKFLFLVVSVVLSGVLISVNYVNGYGAVFFNGSTRKLPIYSVDRPDKKIAISFDCAYGNEYTQGILDTLKEYNVTCTFFTVEFWAKKFPEDLKNIVKYGNEVGTHSATHPNMSKLSKQQVINELTTSKNLIEQLTGEKVTLFRPPFGDYNNTVIETASELGLYAIQWDVDSLDWKDLSVLEIVNRVVKKTQSGSIILCHNNGKNTLKALPYILTQLKAKGYEFKKVSEIIYKDNYTINAYGKQIKNV